MHSAAAPSESDPSAPPLGDAGSHDGRTGLHSTSFYALLIAAGMGALNDNIFRGIALGVGKWIVNPTHSKDPSLVAQENSVASLALALFVIPFLISVAPAGFLADRYSKRNVLVGVKVVEVVLVLLGGALMFYGQLAAALAVLFLMGVHAAIYSPVKYGCLPELLRSESLSAANGALALVTYLGIILGGLFGTILAQYVIDSREAHTLNGLYLILGVMGSVAGVGIASGLLVRPLPPADPARKMPQAAELFTDTARDLSFLWGNKELRYTALGVAFFWSLGGLTQLVVDDFGMHVLSLKRADLGPLQATLAIGIGVGSALAGWLSGGRIELGLSTLGAVGLAVAGCAIGLGGTSADSYVWSVVWLAALGMAGGMYDVPLTSWLQYRSPPKELGSILAASNFLTFAGTLGFTGLFFLLSVGLQLPANSIFLVCGVLSLGMAVLLARSLPYETLRAIVRLALRFVYRIKVYGVDRIPPSGGVLLIPNHVSYMDPILVALASPRKVRMMAWSGNFKSRFMTWLAKSTDTILLELDKGPRAILKALQEAKAGVEAGEVVCIFPEGQLSRTAQLLPFQRGVTRIVEGNQAPVVPVYIDQMWGSIFSFERGKFFWKWPRRLPYRASVHFAAPVEQRTDLHAMRQAVVCLGEEAAGRRKDQEMLLPRQFVRQCRKSLFRTKVTDSLGQSMNGGQLLLRSMVLAKILRAKFLSADESMVGVLLPPSAGGVLANTALALLRKVPVNLNYTVSEGVMNSCIAQCKMKHVLTSKKVMDKLGMKIDAEPIFLEDLKELATTWQKLTAAAETYALPAFVVDHIWGLRKIQPDDPATIVFTSGSTGQPKGVVLTHYNIAAQTASIQQLVNLKKEDVLLGVLPFFHSFGFTITLWTVLSLDPQGVYHISPLDGRVVGDLAEKHGVTILISTPTFLRGYLKRCEKKQFEKLELVLAGAEKVPAELVAAFEERFGKKIYEGYGATEMSPLISVNVPDHRSSIVTQKGAKQGTVGRPIPGVAARILDPETGKELGAKEPGMLYVKGPSLMKGYLDRPDLTAEKIKDGWYDTGDVAFLDEEGFITITGRLSRFSKIGGEMVPHIRIEEELVKAVGGDVDELKLVVTSVPDEKRGERIVVLHVPLDESPQDLCKALSAAGLPNLWIPGTDSFFQVEAIPVLGTGKVALADVKALAKKLTSPAAPAA